VCGGILATYVEALNLLDRGNVMAYTYDAAYADPQPVRTFFGNRTFMLGVEARFWTVASRRTVRVLPTSM
jgi:hypothetical protein